MGGRPAEATARGLQPISSEGNPPRNDATLRWIIAQVTTSLGLQKDRDFFAPIPRSQNG
jgi:hypothetical protein